MKRILLIDEDDNRRTTRILLLRHAGYEVMTAQRFQDVEGHLHEAAYDLVIVETDNIAKESIAYGERIREVNPQLPILLLSDTGLFLPRHVVLSSFASGSPSPAEVMAMVTTLLAQSGHHREK